MRDDFSERTKAILANRVGHQCSNPNCRRPTVGPQEDPQKVINIGVAAHISAAAPGGKRYKSSLSSEERKNLSNGIWLCQTCAKLIDSDELLFSEDSLQEWKQISERAAFIAVSVPESSQIKEQEDIELLRFYAQCFDRPAFQDYISQEGSMEDFDQAMEDTITAINTGALRDRNGSELYRSKGKSFLKNIKWRKQMDSIVDILRVIRSTYRLGVDLGQVQISPASNDLIWNFIRDESLLLYLNSSREEIARVFSSVCKEAGLPEVKFLRMKSRYGHY